MRKAFLMGIAGLILSVQTARAAAPTTTEQQWLTKLEQVKTNSANNKQAYAEMLFAVGTFYHKQHKYSLSVPMYENAMKVFEAQPGNHGDMLRYYSDQLARVYAEQGRNAEAETLYKRAISLGDQMPGKDKTFVVPNSLAGLANLYATENRFDEAIAAQKQRIEMRHRFMNGDQVDVAYVDLANLYTKTGKLDEAKAVIDKLLTMKSPPAEVRTAIASYVSATQHAGGAVTTTN